MGLRGVGVDVADTRRFGRLLDASPERFAQRWFDPAEIEECTADDPAQAYACRFAAKEAVWKAISVPWDGGLPWRSIVVLGSTPDRPPQVRLRGRVGEAARLAGVTSIVVSWDCHDHLAVAIAVAHAE